MGAGGTAQNYTVEPDQPDLTGFTDQAVRCRRRSSTFDYFTEAIVGKSKSSRGDFTASEDDNVLVQGVSRDENAIGYFGYGYYAENQDKRKAVTIVSPKSGKPVLPSLESVIAREYQPLPRPIFIYVNAAEIARPMRLKLLVPRSRNSSSTTSMKGKN